MVKKSIDERRKIRKIKKRKKLLAEKNKLVANTITEEQGTIKIFIHLKNENPVRYQTAYITWFKYLIPFMKTYNIISCNNINDSNIIITTLDKYITIYKDDKYLQKNIILIEQGDAATCNCALAKQENVLYIIKPHILSGELQNSPRLRGRMHMKLLNDIYKRVETSNYNMYNFEELINKVKCIIPHWHRYRSHLKVKNKPLKDRKIDVFFSGTLKYHNKDPHLNIKRDEYVEKCGSLITQHRLDTLNAINKLKCHVYAPNGKLHYKDYLNNLQNSKIFVSPYGNGEFSHKDFECTLYGCILIKPLSNNLISYPNIYEDGVTCISCKLDYSDLSEKVYYLLDHPEIMENINTNVKILINKFKNNDECAKDFYNLLKPHIYIKKILIFNEFNHAASWSRPFIDFINFLVIYFKSKNINVELSDSNKNYDKDYIVFGISGILRNSHFKRFFQHKMIIYNSESLLINETHRNRYMDWWGGRDIIQLWDYSKQNIDFLKKKNINVPLYYVPITYHASFESINKIDNSILKQYDICFFGSINSRRDKIIQLLKKKGYSIWCGSIKSKTELEEITNKSKIVIIIHCYENDLCIDYFRLYSLLSNKNFVIHETPSDNQIDNNMNRLIYAKYDTFVETCEKYLSKTQKERDQIVNDIYDWWKNEHPIEKYIPEVPNNIPKLATNITNYDFKSNIEEEPDSDELRKKKIALRKARRIAARRRKREQNDTTN
jgi:hypothetical protein